VRINSCVRSNWISFPINAFVFIKKLEVIYDLLITKLERFVHTAIQRVFMYILCIS
jgi:hypothetical protein